MDGSLTLLAALLALLAGLAIGKAWERYKLHDGRWVDRRRGRESPHYILGLNFLVANQIDPAIDELTQAAQLAGDPLEIRLILGNLYREKGQVGRAIQEHQALLQRPSIRKLEHANVLLCLGLDYKSGGFVDRALSAFNDVLRLDPANRYALSNLEKLYEEQHQWNEAYETRQRLAALDGPEAQAAHLAILGFIENERGTQALKRMDYEAAAGHFKAAIDLDAANTPAQLNLGDVQFYHGDVGGAIATWEQLIERAPDRAYLAFPRLEGAYRNIGAPGRFADLCRSLIAASPQDWRARLAMARYLAATGELHAAVDLLFAALVQNPHALSLHQSIWEVLCALELPASLVEQYVARTRSAIFYADPHLCVRCRYRSTELLWQCPNCHEWNTFVEERISPAKDNESTLTS